MMQSVNVYPPARVKKDFLQGKGMVMTSQTIPTPLALLPQLSPWIEDPQTAIDLLGLKILLMGESVIDLPAFWFMDQTSIATFLRLALFDLRQPAELSYLMRLYQQAVVYLTEEHHYRLPLELETPKDIYQIFLLANGASQKSSRFACMALKIMHILHHLHGRSLVFATPISEAQLFERLSSRMFSLLDDMRSDKIEVVEFAAGKKSMTSMVTKLLAKRSTVATNIFDTLRFRLILKDKQHLIASLCYLLRHFIPLIYVLPEQSHNAILQASDLAQYFNLPDEQVQMILGGSDALTFSNGNNRFSSKHYKSINFVADIPLRIDDVAAETVPPIAFVQTEIQLLDFQSAKENNLGDSKHSVYKKRQRNQVRQRLEGKSVDLEQKSEA